MSEPIAPGDWVEAVRDSRVPPRAIRQGFLYRVEAISRATDGRCPVCGGPAANGEDGFVIMGVPLRCDAMGHGAFVASMFRPVYRPRAELIRDLMAPAPEIERVA